MSQRFDQGDSELSAALVATPAPKESRGSDSIGARLPVTVVVVNCNGSLETLRCLRAVATSQPPPERLVLVDNGSSDGARDLIEREYQGLVPLTAIWLPANVGLAAARNIAAETIDSRFIAFLDNDTVVSSTWLISALETAAEFRADCVQCKLVLGGDQTRLDSLGYMLGPFGFPRHIVRPGGVDRPEYQQPRLLFGVKAAAMVITRHALERAGGFDPFFFIYGEETDLCWRVLRSGGRIVLAPKSIVLHYSGGTVRFLPNQADPLLYRGGTRNYIRMVAKNSPPAGLMVNLAAQVAIWLGMAGLQALGGKVSRAGLIVRGIMDALANLPSVLRARSESTLPYVNVPRELRLPITVDYVWRTLKEMTSSRS